MHFPSAMTIPHFAIPSTSSSNPYVHHNIHESLRTGSTTSYTEMENPTQGLEGREISDSRAQGAFVPRSGTRGTSILEDRVTDAFVGSTLGGESTEGGGGENADHEMDQENRESSTRGKLFSRPFSTAGGPVLDSDVTHDHTIISHTQTTSPPLSHYPAFDASYGAPYPVGAMSFPHAPQILASPTAYPNPSVSNASTGNSRFGQYIDGVTDVLVPFVYNNPNFPIANALAAARNANASKVLPPFPQPYQSYRNPTQQVHNNSACSNTSERQEQSFIGPLGEAESARREVRLASAKTGSGAGTFVYKLYA